MTKEVGLWVDHRRAFIVTIENEKEVVREVKSNIDKHVRFSNGSGADGPNNHMEPTADDMRDRQFGDHLNGYYDGTNFAPIIVAGFNEAYEIINKIKP